MVIGASSQHDHGQSEAKLKCALKGGAWRDCFTGASRDLPFTTGWLRCPVGGLARKGARTKGKVRPFDWPSGTWASVLFTYALHRTLCGMEQQCYLPVSIDIFRPGRCLARSLL
jgi:hypothetical protein